MAGVFIRRGKDTHRGGHLKTEAEIEVMQPQAMTAWGYHKLEKMRKDSSLKPSVGSMALVTR